MFKSNSKVMLFFLWSLAFLWGPALQTVIAQDDVFLQTRLLVEDPAPPGLQPGELAGHTVAMDGRWMIASGRYGIYIFEFTGMEWIQKQRLIINEGVADPKGWFATTAIYSVDIEGSRAVVGLRNTNGVGPGPLYDYLCTVYIFEYNGIEWIETQQIPRVFTRDGNSPPFLKAALHGNRLIVGSVLDAIIYQFDGSSLVQEAVIPGSGSQIDIYGDKAVVGTRVYRYSKTNGTWNQMFDLGSLNAVDIYKERIIVGDTFFNNNRGRALVYKYDEKSDNYLLEQTITKEGASDNDLFGSRVVIGDNFLAISEAIGIFNVNDNAATTIYESNGLQWKAKSRVTSDPSSPDEAFGYSISLDQNSLMIGAPFYETNVGCFYFYELLARPRNVQAADGESASQVRITWDNGAFTNAEGFKIYRDGIEIGSTVLAARAFSDIDALPGKLYNYQVTSYNNNWGESATSNPDLGWRRANGRISGFVQTEQGAGVEHVVVSATPVDRTLGYSLFFDNADEYVAVPFMELHDTLSISAWIKTTSNNNQQIIGWGNTRSEDRAEFKTVNGTLAFSLTTSAGNFQVTGSTNIADGNWHHVAVITGPIFGYLAVLYVDGVLEDSESRVMGKLSQADVDYMTIGAYERGQGNGLSTFSGEIDDIRIWQKFMFGATAEEYGDNLYESLTGNEAGLRAYWPFDDFSRAPEAVAADYSWRGNHHGMVYGAKQSNEAAPVDYGAITNVDGNYSIGNLYYEELREFRIIPKKEDHSFDPAYKDIVLDSGIGPFLTFTDTTVFTLSGQILFAGEDCPVEGVELLLNDLPTGIFTDSEGNFQIPVEEPGKTYKITPQYGDSSYAHSFSPANISLFVDDDIDNIIIQDMEKHTLSGRVRGGCIAGLGVARMRITSLDNPECLDKIITSDINGNFRMRLPAQKYIVDLVAIDNPDSVNILKYIDTDTVDITWAGNSTNYIYHPKPLVRLEILPGVLSCDNVPIFEQNSSYSILIDVLEVYGTDTCHVDEGFVTIYDDIGGNPAEPTVIQLENGRALYNFVAGVPNILGGGAHPFQKLLQIQTQANGYTVNDEQWAIVTGSRPRTQTFFSTATPELPFMILRDPPGDQSYSFLSKGSTYTTEFYTTINSDSSGPGRSGIENYKFNHGGTIESIGAEAGFLFASATIATEFGGYYIDVRNELFGAESGSRKGDILSLTMTEELRTSDDQFVTGTSGDVFIGASINQTFYLADVINYDPVRCEVNRDTTLVVNYTGFKSSYVYTESHISNVLIPQLKELQTLAGTEEDAFRYSSAISVWEQVLQRNKDTKAKAQSKRRNPNIPDPEYLLEKNISFSGGTHTTQTSTIQTDSYNSISYSTYIGKDELEGGGTVVAGAVLEFGWQYKWEKVWSNTQDTINTEINTVGYTLADDDFGDYFSVDVLHDPYYGTPVFNLVAGTSSCPWEPGTQPRDGAFLGISSFIQNDVPPDEPATFELTLGNLSESGEDRPYDLRIEQLSNPDGAIIKVGGVPMADALSYYIPAGDSSYKATLTVERGPRAYDYDNIRLVLLPPCEYDLYYGATPLADTVTFSVHFASPISKASLSYPRDNWEIDPDEPNALAIVIDEYNRNNEYLESVQLQYRKPNGSWQTAFNVARNELPDQQLRRSWNFQDIPDGEYELRAVSNGGSNGMRYSPVATGRIERNTLLVRGNPEPADRVLNIGEEISVSFASGIDVEKLVAQRDISLIDAADSTAVDFSISVLGNKLVIQPDSSFSYLGERTLIATVYNLSDKDGKRLNQPLSWQFKLSQQAAYWKSLAAEIKMYQGVETVNKAVLYNAGTTVVDYKIDYLPRWLSVSADQLSGSLAPGTERHVTFSSGSITTSGILNDSIAVLLDGKRESRPLTLNVLPAPPDWSLAGAPGGAYAAEVYTQLLLDEKLSHDTFDFAGVFIDGRLSGMGHIRPDDMTGKYVAAFKIYSQTPAAGALDFRLWDASEGKEYRFYSDEFSFQAGTSVGSRLEPLIIQPNEVFQSIALDQGVNWLSFNVTGSDLSVDRVLRDWPAQTGDVIKSQYGFSQYSKETGWTGTLDVLRPELGYRLRTDQPGELVTAGTPANLWVSPAALSSGWNWVGYLPEKALAVKDALYFMQAVPGDVIKSQNQSAIYNNNGEWLGTLREMHPGQSYSIYSQANTELIYPELQKQTGSGETAGLTLDPHAFEANMTVTAAITFDGADYGDSSYVVSAFVDGQLRGAGYPQYVPHLDRYITFLMIYGDAQGNGEPVRIQVFNPADNMTRDVETDLVFGADAHYGDLQEPLMLSAQQNKSERIPDTYYLKQNYPNPFNPLTTIEYGLPVDENVTVTIYDVLGQKVTVLVDGKQLAGRYKLQFDAGNIGMASGVYFYQIRTSAFVRSYKMLLLK